MQKFKLHSSAVLAANLLLVAVFLSSCNETKNQKNWSKYKFGVTLHGGKGMSSGYSIIYCDSFQMTGLLSADVWVDGTKLSVKTDEKIAVWSNGN